MNPFKKLKIKKILVFLYFVYLAFPSILLTKVVETDWTILVYAQTKNDLYGFFIKNLRDMAQVGSNEKLNLLIQWEQPKKDGIWRYKVTKGRLELALHLPSLTGKNCATDVVDFVKWGISNYSAKHYALILSGHGSGGTDPNFRHNLNIAKRFSKENGDIFRGILFNWESRTYLDNQQLAEAMQQINKILGGNKLDVLGFDACQMADIAILYQIKDQVKFFVGSQEQEHADGWFYSAFLQQLASKNITPPELVNSIVNTYGLYYKNRLNWFTQSAVNLEDIGHLKNNIDSVVADLQKSREQYGNTIKNIVQKARESCLQFHIPFYIDLNSFYRELYKEIQNCSLNNVNTEENNPTSSTEANLFGESNIDDFFCYTTLKNYTEENKTLENTSLTFTENNLPIENVNFDSTTSETTKQSIMISPLIEQLKKDLVIGMKLIETTVIANTVGPSVAQAKGISIYFPPKNSLIDISYLKTKFAQESLWLQLLKDGIR